MKKENKKKVVTLSAMAALLAVVLGMGGKTYAKYFTESDAPAQTATVAKWGFVSNMITTADGAFSKTYGSTVVSTGTKMVVAPGTSGSITYTISGSAEVSATVEYNLTNYIPVSLTVAGENYLPILWTITVDDNTPETARTADELQTKASGSFNYNANTTGFSHTVKLAWEWAFEATTENTYPNDDYDTALGQLAQGLTPDLVGYSNPNTDLSYDFSVTIEQVD